jgi:hypothetical protein
MPPFTSNNGNRSFGRSRNMQNRSAGDDMLMPEQSTYLAVVNPTSEIVQAWGRGRRGVFVPGELGIAKRACVQIWRTPIAAQMVQNQRKFLVRMSVDAARMLVRRAKELGNFYAAWAEFGGGQIQNRAASVVREKKVLDALRRQLNNIGIDMTMSENWSAQRCRQVLKSPELAYGPATPAQPEVSAIYDGPQVSPQEDEDEDLPVIDEYVPRPRGRGPDTAAIDEDEPLAEANARTLGPADEIKAAARKSFDLEQRARIVGELRRLGVQYHGRLSTQNLSALLDKALASPASVGA